eukprot:6437614-Lingulodinium_polyedra.AAC.1
MEVARSGRFHRLKISDNHSCPRRSNAFSWSARATAGARRRKCAAGSSAASNSARSASMAVAAGPKTSVQRGSGMPPVSHWPVSGS